MGVGVSAEAGITALAVEDDEALAPPFQSNTTTSVSVGAPILSEADKRFEESAEEAELAVEGFEIPCD